MAIFGEIVKNTREKSGLTQRELAKKLNLPRTVISMIETGSRIPTRKQYLEIIRLFNIPENDIREIIETEIIDQMQTITGYDLLKLLRTIE